MPKINTNLLINSEITTFTTTLYKYTAWKLTFFDQLTDTPSIRKVISGGCRKSYWLPSMWIIDCVLRMCCKSLGLKSSGNTPISISLVCQIIVQSRYQPGNITGNWENLLVFSRYYFFRRKTQERNFSNKSCLPNKDPKSKKGTTVISASTRRTSSKRCNPVNGIFLRPSNLYSNDVFFWMRSHCNIRELIHWRVNNWSFAG